jgi:hypothetical protein
MFRRFEQGVHDVRGGQRRCGHGCETAHSEKVDGTILACVYVSCVAHEGGVECYYIIEHIIFL